MTYERCITMLEPGVTNMLPHSGKKFLNIRFLSRNRAIWWLTLVLISTYMLNWESHWLYKHFWCYISTFPHKIDFCFWFYQSQLIYFTVYIPATQTNNNNYCIRNSTPCLSQSNVNYEINGLIRWKSNGCMELHNHGKRGNNSEVVLLVPSLLSPWLIKKINDNTNWMNTQRIGQACLSHWVHSDKIFVHLHVSWVQINKNNSDNFLVIFYYILLVSCFTDGPMAIFIFYLYPWNCLGKWKTSDSPFRHKLCITGGRQFGARPTIKYVSSQATTWFEPLAHIYFII